MKVSKEKDLLDFFQLEGFFTELSESELQEVNGSCGGGGGGGWGGAPSGCGSSGPCMPGFFASPSGGGW